MLLWTCPVLRWKKQRNRDGYSRYPKYAVRAKMRDVVSRAGEPLPSRSHLDTLIFRRLPKLVYVSEIDNFVATSAEDRLDHE